MRQARSLAAKSSLSRHQITKQVAEKLGIAQETLRTILLQYEKKNPDKPVFRRPLGRIRPADAAELFRLYKQGTGIHQLMERFDRSRATVHRIINQRRALTLLARKIEYVPSDEFLQTGAREQILGHAVHAFGGADQPCPERSEWILCRGCFERGVGAPDLRADNPFDGLRA